MAEYNVLEEIGMMLDKQTVCSCYGFISKNNISKQICTRYVRNGDRVFDVLSRYDYITAYLLNRADSRAGNVMKFVTPFLKAFGVTDHDMFELCKSNLDLVPGAGPTMRYLYNLMPTFITTSEFEHHIMNVCEAIDFPQCNVTCADADFDSIVIGRSEAKELRDMASKISALRVPKADYALGVPTSLDDLDVKIVDTLDKMLVDRLPHMDIAASLKDVTVIGANEKAYALLEVRRRTEVDLDSTVYIGGDATDYQALDLVRDSDGLAISFNGTEFGVRGANIAVMAKDSTVVAVLAQEFYNKGIEAVYSLVGNWDRKALKEVDCPDRHLMDAMLATNPRKLPDVRIVDRDNVDDIAAESDAYRRKFVR